MIQNEGMRTILGCTRDTSAEAMRYLLDFPCVDERHKLAQIQAYLRVSADETNEGNIMDDLSHKHHQEELPGTRHQERQGLGHGG